MAANFIGGGADCFMESTPYNRSSTDTAAAIEQAHDRLEAEMRELQAKAAGHAAELERLASEQELHVQEQRQRVKRDFLEANLQLADERRERAVRERQEAVDAELAGQGQVQRELELLQARAVENQRRLQHNQELDLQKCRSARAHALEERRQPYATSLMPLDESTESAEQLIEAKSEYRQELKQAAEQMRLDRREQQAQQRRAGAEWTSLPIRDRRQEEVECKRRYRQELTAQIQQKQAARAEDDGARALERMQNQSENEQHERLEHNHRLQERQQKQLMAAEQTAAMRQLQGDRQSARAREQQMEREALQVAERQQMQRAMADRARVESQQSEYQAEIALQIKYKKLLEQVQREKDKMLATMAPPGLG